LAECLQELIANKVYADSGRCEPLLRKDFARIDNLLPRYNVDDAIWAESIA